MIDTNKYPKGIKILEKDLKTIRFQRHEFHGDWIIQFFPILRCNTYMLTISKAIAIEATTELNTQKVWTRLQWSGDSGEAVPGHPNRRRLSRSNSMVLRPAVSLDGNTESVEIWVLAATIEIRSRGRVTPNSAPFDAGIMPGTDSGPDLGPVVYEGFPGQVYPGNQYIRNMGARGKIVAVAALTPYKPGEIF
jgi:hypothetical protein